MIGLFLRNCDIDLNVARSTIYGNQYVETPQHPWTDEWTKKMFVHTVYKIKL